MEGRWERGIVESEGECALNAGGRWELVFGRLSLEIPHLMMAAGILFYKI